MFELQFEVMDVSESLWNNISLYKGMNGGICMWLKFE